MQSDARLNRSCALLLPLLTNGDSWCGGPKTFASSRGLGFPVFISHPGRFRVLWKRFPISMPLCVTQFMSLFHVRILCCRPHKGIITSVCWYPVDTGVFVSGSADGVVTVWDANRFEPAEIVMPFAMHSEEAGRVLDLAMPPTGTCHAMIAGPSPPPHVFTPLRTA
jgi:hypothetical protein